MAVVILFLIALFMQALLVVDSIITYRRGPCPDVQTVPNFDFRSFEGKWYAIKVTKGAHCLTYDFELDDDGTRKVIEESNPLGIRIPYIWDKLSRTGTLSSNQYDTARMTISFAFSLIPFLKRGFWVVSTDYETYAIIYSCRHLLKGHKDRTILLARYPEPDKVTMQFMNDFLDSNNITTETLFQVDQQSCDHEVPPKPNPPQPRPPPTSDPKSDEPESTTARDLGGNEETPRENQPGNPENDPSDVNPTEPPIAEEE